MAELSYGERREKCKSGASERSWLLRDSGTLRKVEWSGEESVKLGLHLFRAVGPGLASVSFPFLALS
jgi:hypothetical protein